MLLMRLSLSLSHMLGLRHLGWAYITPNKTMLLTRLASLRFRIEHPSWAAYEGKSETRQLLFHLYLGFKQLFRLDPNTGRQFSIFICRLRVWTLSKDDQNKKENKKLNTFLEANNFVKYFDSLLKFIVMNFFK